MADKLNLSYTQWGLLTHRFLCEPIGSTAQPRDCGRESRWGLQIRAPGMANPEFVAETEVPLGRYRGIRGYDSGSYILIGDYV